MWTAICFVDEECFAEHILTELSIDPSQSYVESDAPRVEWPKAEALMSLGNGNMGRIAMDEIFKYMTFIDEMQCPNEILPMLSKSVLCSPEAGYGLDTMNFSSSERYAGPNTKSSTSCNHMGASSSCRLASPLYEHFPFFGSDVLTLTTRIYIMWLEVQWTAAHSFLIDKFMLIVYGV